MCVYDILKNDALRMMLSMISRLLASRWTSKFGNNFNFEKWLYMCSASKIVSNEFIRHSMNTVPICTDYSLCESHESYMKNYSWKNISFLFFLKLNYITLLQCDLCNIKIQLENFLKFRTFFLNQNNLLSGLGMKQNEVIYRWVNSMWKK